MNDRPNPGWFGRNWKWLVPSGCLSVLLLAAFALFTVIGLGMKGLSGLVSSTEPVAHAIQLAEADPTVLAALGKPLKAGTMVQGSLSTNNANGHADMMVPLKGPKGSADLYIKAEREAGRWSYSLIEIAIDGSGQRVNLLGKDVGANTAPEKTSKDREIAPPDIDQPPAKDKAAPQQESEEDEPPPPNDVSATAAADRGTISPSAAPGWS